MNAALENLLLLLILHRGACSIPKNCKMVAAAQELQSIGFIEMHEAGTCYEIHIFNFKPEGLNR